MLTGKTVMIMVSDESCGEEIKYKIQDKEGIPLDQQRLISGRREIQDHLMVKDYPSIKEDRSMHLVLSRSSHPLSFYS